MTAHYPVFVYGTLRPGMSNYHWFRSADSYQIDATITGYELLTNGSYPFMVPATGEAATDSVVQGTLIFVDAHQWETVVAALDELEGTAPGFPVHHDNLYNRVLTQVTARDGTIYTAWVYIPPEASQARLRELYPVLTGGEWSE